MPCDYRKYPSNWKTEIRPMILARAGFRCEWCGAPHQQYIIRREAGWEDACPEEPGAVYIILTVAHVDHDIAHNDSTNLAALCQKCHLTHDARQHVDSARRNREQRDGQALLEGIT